MLRILDAERHVAEVRDPISGALHELYYRLPTSKERVAYQGSFVKRLGKKITMRKDTFSIHVKFAAKVLQGFKTGTFSYDGAVISCNEAEDGTTFVHEENGKKVEYPIVFRKDWRELLEKTAADVIAPVANLAFGSAEIAQEDPKWAVADDFDEDDEADEDGGDTDAPLSEESSDT